MSFTATPSGCGIPRTYTLTNTTTGGQSGTATYYWKIGNNTVFDTTSGTAGSSIQITAPGTYTLKMIGVNGSGCRDSISTMVVVTTAAQPIFDPTTSTFNYAPLWQNCIFFLNSPDSFRIVMSSSGTLNNYRVLWGDGHADSGSSLAPPATLTHNYTSLGTYTVRIVTQNGGCYDTVTGSVVNERIPTAGVIGPPSGGNVGCVPHTVRFINNSYNVSANTFFRWTMGDGNSLILPSGSANDTLFYQYNTGLCNGTVSVEAINACGISQATWNPIFINDRDDARFTINNNLCGPSVPLMFVNTSQNRYCTPSARLFYWNFGDGDTIGWSTNGAPQSHIYTRPGTYTVTLLDSNQCGIDTFRMTIPVNFIPEAGFIVSDTIGCGPLRVTVTDTTASLGNFRYWDFGNGVVSSDSSDTVVYTIPGTYNLSLTITNVCGSDTKTRQITVWSPPTALFANIDSACVPHTVSYTNQSDFVDSSTVHFKWYFGDGDSSSAAHPPPKTYHTPGLYTVTLVVNDTCGTDTFRRTFRVYPLPDANFTFDTVCQGNLTRFTNLSAVPAGGGSINQNSWSFGDGGTSSNTHPTRTYAVADTFPVRLIVRTNRGCRDTVIRQVIVVPRPDNSFTVSPDDSICLGIPLLFNGSVIPHFGTTATHRWNFGNGQTSSQEDTSFLYTAAGNYQVSLVSANAFGCQDTARTTIVVHPLPVVNIKADTACIGATTHFTDQSSLATGTIASRRWDLNNDGVFDSTGAFTSFIYTTLGTKMVRLHITTDFGCTATDSFQIQVYPLPVPGIAVDSATICEGDSVTITNSSTGAARYSFDFGDGSPLFFTNVSGNVRHVFADSGVFTIKMIAYSGQGCPDSAETQVVVRPRPQAQYTVNRLVACAPFNFEFTNTSQKSNSYRWLTNGSFTTAATHLNDTLIQADSQAVTVVLVAFNNASCPSDTFTRIIGTARNPVSSFTIAPDSGCGPLLAGFTNTSSFSSSYRWNFGNGITSERQDTSVRFTAAAVNDTTYTVRLISYNWLGCPDTSTGQVVVHANPVVAFGQSRLDSCGPLQVAFTNTSVHPAGGNIGDMRFRWDFGNGLASSSRDTSVGYVASVLRDTVYQVSLIGYSRYGCSDTVRSTVRVYPDPVARFSQSRLDSCGPLTVNFTNTSFPNDTGTISIMHFAWDLGNGQTSISRNATGVFAPSLSQDSSYTVRLIAYSEHGCPDTATSMVRTFPKPLAAYTQSDTSGCGPLTVSFTNFSVPYDTGSIADMSFRWDFGNGVSSTRRDTSVRFTAASQNDTVYTVRLIAYSEHGCADTTFSTVRVHPGPVASFSVNRSVACAPFLFTFNNLSINANSYRWLVNGQLSHNLMSRPDTLVLADTQSIRIGLIAQTSLGCPEDTTFLNIGTARNPISSFTIAPDSGCGPLLADFTNTSSFSSSYRWNFGNGITSARQDTSVRFTAAAINDTTYTVRLISYNWLGCPDTSTGQVVVHANPVVAFDQSRLDSCGPLQVAFTSTSVHPAGGNIGDMRFRWDFGNGLTSGSRDTSVGYVASALRDTVYQVSLIGYSRYGCSDTARSTVRVYPDPVARFSQSRLDSCGPLTVNFTNTSFPNDTGTISIMHFAWELGNGQTSILRNATGVFAPSLSQDSSYTVRLIAYSEHGCPDTATSTVRTFPKPLAAYTQSDTSGCGPLTVSFTNFSVPYDTGSIADMSFRWDFGNGVSSTRLDTAVRFTAAAQNDTVYTVRLIAYSEHGCADTAFSTVRVHPKPSIALNQDNGIGCDPVRVNFTGTGVNVAVYHWNFGDGNTSVLQNPRNDFRGRSFYDTTYQIRLFGTSPFGCNSDTIGTQVTVSGGPEAAFTVFPDSVCATTTSQMINGSLGAISYVWNFGTGSTSTAANPQALFPLNPVADTTYNIYLVATNIQGCRDTATGHVVVSPIPTAAFTADVTNGCGPLQVRFTDHSVFAQRYNWIFGNGQTSNAASPQVTFTNSGIIDSVYHVRLIVTNLSGCTDTAEIAIRVYPLPTTSFTATPQTGCGNLGVAFTNTSVPNDTGSINIMSFQWLLGNGQNPTTRNASTTYPRSLVQDSIYQVRLIGLSEHGCRDTAFQDIRVFPKPLSRFVQSDTSGCGPLTVGFTNLSVPYDTGNISIMSFQWSFGNGQTGTNANETVTFYPSQIQDTVYTIRLISLSEHGCRDTSYSRVRVHPAPRVGFSASVSSGCGPLPVNFTSNTLNVQTHYWDFGNGTTSAVANPSVIFQNRPDLDTVYTVRYWARSPFGCWSDTVTRTITVRPDPVARFSQGADSICGTTNVLFSNLSTGATSFSWNFGNGNTSGSVNPQQVFAMNPLRDTTYTVRMIATNVYGCRDTAIHTVTIFPFPKAVIATNDSNGCTPYAAAFNHNSLRATQYNWSFGNGVVSSSPTVNTVFANHGIYDTIYNVKLVVTSNRGCKDSTLKSIRVYPLPTTSFTATPQTGCGNLGVAFTNTSVPNDTGSINIMSFQWRLGNGQNPTTRNASTTYPRSLVQDSIYQVRLIGLSEHGCRDTAFQDIRVFPKPLSRFVQSDTSGCGPLAVSFTNLSVPYDTGNISIMSFQWSFGNGQTGTNANETVTFYPSQIQDTVYTIRLISLSEHGCRDTSYSRVRVHPAPRVGFSASASSGCGPLPVNFTSNTLNVQTHYWDFGNGTTSAAANPSVIFQNRPDLDTVYTVRYWARSPFGCWSDTVIRTITVRPDPIADFTQNIDSICGTATLLFSNLSTGATSFSWNFGNGNTSGSVNPQQVFAMNPLRDTTYTVRMIATNVYGCRDTAIHTVTIFPFPKAVIATNDSNGCTPCAAAFNQNSLRATQYSWSFGNGVLSSSPAVNTVFANHGIYDTIYNVKLLVTSNRGCKDSTLKSIRVYPLPTTSFTATPQTGCGNLGVAFTNTSVPNDTGSINIMSFQWRLGNGQSAVIRNASTTYLRSQVQDSIYQVRLIGLSEHGCRDTAFQDIRVFPKPLSRFVQSDTSGCGPLTVGFTNLSVPYDTGNISIMSFQWSFGNGQTGTNANETVTFYPSQIQDTVYTIRLISLSEHGCRDTSYSRVRVHPAPRVGFSASTSSGCGPLPVNFTSNTLNVQTHYWDFGNGTTSAAANPSVIFQNRPDLDTVYIVRYWARSPFGCWSDTVIRTITVRPDPIADFTQNKDSLCGGGTINFVNLSASANAYSWNFGDGSAASTLVNPPHSFAMDPLADKVYPVRLIAVSMYGCRDTVIRPTTIFPLPTAVITLNPDTGCTPLLVNFGQNSLLGARYHWWFGDGDTSTAQYPVHTFSNLTGINQVYRTVLLVQSVHLCEDLDTIPVTIFPLPRPAFNVTRVGVCDTSEFRFTNVTAGAVSYLWDFGDGTTSTQSDPLHIYPTALNNDTLFTARLYATTVHGCVDSFERQITVPPVMMAFAATNNAGGCPPLPVQFTNLSRNAKTYYWDFGDGFVSTLQHPFHTFTNPDPAVKVYTVTLVVSNNLGCSDSTQVLITLQPHVDAFFTAGKTGRCDVAEHAFTNGSAGAATYAWNFGDGTTSTQVNPVHIFPVSTFQDTSYTVRLVARSVNGCYDTLFRTLVVNPLVRAQFAVNAQEACSEMQALFTNQSINARFYIWDFGDGSGSAQTHPTHPYIQVGSYLPSLIAFDANGCSDTFVLLNPVNIWETPVANFISTPTSRRLPQSNFNFIDLSITSTTLVYAWDFGEPASGVNNSSTLQNPAHTYADSGNYAIRLIVDNTHCRDTADRTVRVDYYYPIAAFDQDPDTGCMPHTVNFINQSRFAKSYRWFFGDGGQSTDENPVHTYLFSGKYTVTLIATSPEGSDDSTKQEVIVVLERPHAGFYANPLTGYLPDAQFVMTNVSTLATSYRWDLFNESGVSIYTTTQENPIIVVNEQGTFSTRLIARNDLGCYDTAYISRYLNVNVDGVILVPDAFTPNGDGTNDGFKPVMEGVREDGYTFIVFNRWGERIFVTHDIDAFWDGKFQAVPCQVDMYVWQVQGFFHGGKNFKEFGRVMLMR